MKNTKKPARGRKFNEGSVVKSLRESDGGVVISMSKKKNGWVYTVFFDGAYKAVVRNEEELEEF